MKRNKKIFQVVFWLALVAFFVVSSIPVDSVKQFTEEHSSHVRPDYLLHFFAYCILGSLSILAYKTRWKTFLIMIVFAVIEEGHQYWVPYRTLNGFDLISDLAGLGFIFGIAYLVKKHRPREM